MDGNLLTEVRVLELGEYVSAPFCAKLMAALGAQVTKIEKPGGGDPVRRLGPFPKSQPHPENAGLYLYLNTGKRSVTLNVETAEGHAMLGELVANSDIIVENTGPTAARKAGLTHDLLAKDSPTLITCSISAFGQSGPYRDFGADELCYQAIGGMMNQTGDSERAPLKSGEFPLSYIAGYAAFAASMAALYSRKVTGKGQHIDLSIAEIVISSIASAFVRYQYTGRAEERGRSLTGMLVPCRDGFVTLSLVGRMWSRLTKLISGLAEDARFDTEEGRRRNFAEIEAAVSTWALEHSRKEVVDAGQAVGLAVDYLLTVDEAADSPQYHARSFITQIDHPIAGLLRYPGLPFTIGGTSLHLGRAPLLGEHNEEVYSGLLGYTSAELTRLFTAGVI